MSGYFHVRHEVVENFEITLKTYLSLYFVNSLNNILSGYKIERIKAFKFLSKNRYSTGSRFHIISNLYNICF